MIDNFEGKMPRFDKSIARALANNYAPTREQLKAAWRDVAFANFIGESTDEARRPIRAQWEASRAAFRAWLNKYRPGHVLVCGLEMWGAISPVKVRSREALALPRAFIGVNWAKPVQFIRVRSLPGSWNNRFSI